MPTDLLTKFKNFIFTEETYEFDEDYEYEEENDYVDEETQPYMVNTPDIDTFNSQATVSSLTPVKTTVVMLSPIDIKSSQTVIDHIREGHIVICNLLPSINNQRVVDYISGGIYAFNGRIEPTAIKTTFVCTPENVDLITQDSNSQAMAMGE